MNNKIVQICGMISDLPVEEAWENFNNTEKALKEKYPQAKVINPLKLCNHITEAYNGEEPPYQFYIDVCLASLNYADVLATMDNAHLSKGGRIEMKEAFKLGKEILPLKDIL